MCVREREHRKKREGQPANSAATAMDPNPVVILVVRLLKAAAMTNDRISLQGFRSCLRPAKILAGSGAPPPEEKSN